MSGETEEQVSGWTTDTLKAYFERRFELTDRATAVALAANEKRLDGMNEFRQTLADQTASFLPRAEFEESRKAARAFTLAVVGAATAFMGVGVAAVALITR